MGEPGVTSRRLLAVAAALAGVMAAFAGSPQHERRAAADVSRLAAAVAHEEDHVTATELATWIRDRKPRLRIIDLRNPPAFDTYHLPNAENASIETAVSMPFRSDETIVLISDGGAHAAQAWVLLETLGNHSVYFLRGGLGEWIDDVMNPTLPPHASTEALAAFHRASELSRYFGGVPRTAPRLDLAAPHTDAAAMRRRGC
jgi:rhodanese-related sulfurtransferase